MKGIKELTERYLHGELNDTEREQLLVELRNDSCVDRWLRTDIELSANEVPEQVKTRVLDAVLTTPQIETDADKVHIWPLIKRYVAAACVTLLLLLVGGGTYWLGKSHNANMEQGQLLVKTHVGERSSVTLPDGTRVILNAQTQLTYDCAMPDNERRVKVDGEAYFDVAKDKDHPFVVCCDGLRVRCLGTAFNIRSYADEKDISVVLTEGKVQVSADDAYLTMEPNSRVVYDKATQAMSKQYVKADDYTCWLNNEIRYNDHTLEQIAQELSRNYHINMVITSDNLKQERFTGYLGHCSLRNVLDILSMTSNMSYYIDQDTVVYVYERN